MAQADGRIVIETSLESGGMKAGAKEIADACKNAAQTAAQMGGKAPVAIEKATNAISRQNAAYAQQLSKVDALRKKLNQMKEEYERGLLTDVLKNCNWNCQMAANELGIHRSALYKKIAKYELQKR